jgi:hypothetical protein
MSDSTTIPLLRSIKTYFTPAEANALLPQLLPDLDLLANGIGQAQELNEILADEADPAMREAIERDLEELHLEARDALGRVQSHGVEIKRIEPALLDFPALHQGVEVLLCWREGEAEVDHWHPLHAGFRGRVPIETDVPGTWEYWS